MVNILQLFSVKCCFCLLLIICMSYLLGSVSFSIIFTKIFLANKDIRTLGSCNAGLTNVLRSAGKLPGILTLICDFFKGILAILLSYFVFKSIGVSNFEVLKYIEYISGLSCILGHIYPCFFKFKGGKGVLTFVSVVFMVDWRLFICFIIVFLLVLFTSKIVSLASILASFSLYLINFVLLYFKGYRRFNGGLVRFDYIYIFISTVLLFIMSMLIIYTHRSNIKRLVNGNERNIGNRL